MSFLYIPMSRGSNGSNTFVGVGALQNVTTGVDNSAFGFYALNALVSGNRNTAVGSEALLLNTSSNNTAVGSGALRGSTTGQNNVALGQDAMRAGNPNNGNVAVGYSAMYNCGLTENSVGIGQLALYNAAGTIGNTAVGNTAGLLITTGSKNTILGAFTGNQFGLDIRTLSNYIVISDGDGNPRIWVDNTGQVNFPGGTVLPGGTANGVLYLNASSVVTSGTALTFDGTNIFSLSATGAQTTMRALASAGQTATLQIAANGNSGGVTSLDIVQDSSSNGYVFQRANAPLIFGVNNAEQMRLTSTGLGIGTSSPSNLLTLGGSTGGIDFEGWNDNRIVLRQDFDASYYQQIVFDAANRDFRIQSNSSDSTAKVTFWTGASGTVTERMRLDSSGNLGLGVTPSAWASYFAAVQAGNASKGGAFVSAGGFSAYGHNYYEDSGGVNRYIQSTYALKYATQGNGAHAWYTAPSWDGTGSNAISFTQAMTLTAAGDLALGATSASDKLHVEGSISTYIRAQSSNNSTRGGFKAFGKTAGGANVQVDFVAYGDAPEGGVNVATNHRLTLGTNNTERASIPAAGGMVVGTAAIATTATDGFLYVPTCAGAPTGTPTTQTGTAPIVVDTTNNKLYFYSGGAWRDAGP